MKSIDIRSAIEGDREWLVTLQTNPVFNRWIGRSQEKIDELAEDVSLRLQAEASGRGKTLIASVGPISCGYGTVFYSVSRQSGFVEFGVDPLYFGIGIGGAILDALISVSQQLPTVRCIKATCRYGNLACIRLLESRGFLPATNNGSSTGKSSLEWILTVV